jgi:HPt (histidine-containing phosphotransfer) domain-containing protein
MDDFVSKPVILDDLERLIIKWEGVTDQRTADFPMQGDKSSVAAGPVPLINQEAIQRLMDIGRQTDPGFLQQVLDMFMNQAPLSMEEIRQQFEKGDFTGMWKAAHKLKGTCLNIGAARLAEVCKEIERKGRNLEIGGLLGLTMQLENDYKSTLKELRSLFQYN